MTTPPTSLRPEWIPNAYKEEAAAIADSKGKANGVTVPRLSSAKKTLIKRRRNPLYKKP